MRLALLLILLLAACGGPRKPEVGVDNRSEIPPDAAPGRAPVQCGAATCGPDEYCEMRCTCCGIRPAEPDEASGTAACLPLPDTCLNGGDGPECDQRTVEVPCA